jgi:GntR family transcriptional regulator, rspAB operon transcriptional repressor
VSVLELGAIKAERVTDAVYEMLKESIVHRRLAPRSKINIDELTQRLGVSRTPVHEALVLLATDGLVEIVPRRGSFVADFTLVDIAETLDVRRALELLACERAAPNAGPDDIVVLRRLMRDMEACVRGAASLQEAARAHDAKNLEFHQLLVGLSGNKRLIATYQALGAHLRIARAHLEATAWRDRLSLERAEHGAIVTALERRAVAPLQGALERHLRRSSTSLIDDLKQEGHGDA